MLEKDFFYRYLFSKRAGAVVTTISRLSVLGVCVGVSSLIVVLSVMNGFSDTIRKRLLVVEPHLVVEFREETKGLIPKAMSAISKIPEVEEVGNVETQDVLIRAGEGSFGGAIAKGVGREDLKRLTERLESLQQDTQGEERRWVLSLKDIQLEPGDVIMGIDLVRSLGLLEGDHVALIAPEALLLPPGEIPRFERVRVKAVLYSRLADVDSKLIYYVKGETLRNMRDTLSRRETLDLRLKDPDSYTTVQKKLKHYGMASESWVDRNSSLFYALATEKRIMATFLSLSTLIASFSILTVMVLLMTQKRRDIGLLLALGMSKKRAERLFQNLGLILSGIGVLGGIVLGLLVCFLIRFFPLNILPDIYYDTSIAVHVRFFHLLAILFGSAVIAFLGTYGPVRWILQLSPADCLRKNMRQVIS